MANMKKQTNKRNKKKTKQNKTKQKTLSCDAVNQGLKYSKVPG